MITLQEIQRYCPEYNGDFSAIEADVNSVFHDIKNIVGHEFDYNKCVYLETLEECIANLAIAEYIAHSIIINQSGVQRIETDKYKSAFKYQQNELIYIRKQRGYKRLESFIFLNIQRGNYKLAYPTQYKQITKRLLNFSFEVKHLEIEYSVFKSILPIIDLIESEVLIPLLGENLYTTVKDKIYNDNTLTDIQKMLIENIQNALSAYAIQIAMENNLAQIRNNQVVSREANNQDENNQYNTISLDYYNIVMNSKKEYTQRYFNKIKQFLIANAEALNWTIPQPTQKVIISTDTQKLKSIF